MNQRQRLIIVVLAVVDLIVVAGVCGVIASNALGQQAARPPTPPPTPVPSPTFTPTPESIPTWTPAPSPTPYASPTPAPHPLGEQDAAAFDQVEQQVATLRGLPSLRPVSRWKVTRAQMRQGYVDRFIGDAWVDVAHSWGLVLAAFDLVEPGTDLLAEWRTGFAEWVAGFYAVETEEIHVVSDSYSAGAWERLVYAHEFGHALQDQHFDLEKLGLDLTGAPGQTDRLLALQALIEGDAELIEASYQETYFTQADTVELWNVSHAAFTWADSDAPVLDALSSFPYDDGEAFVRALYDEGGWPAVDAAYANPPTSTEQILHPERYLAGDGRGVLGDGRGVLGDGRGVLGGAPLPLTLPPLTGTLGGGYRLIYADTMGELLLRLHLENQIPAAQAAVAAAGWGGDLCAAYHDAGSGQTVVLLRIAWDTAADLEEFLAAYQVYAEVRFGHAPEEYSATAGLVTETASCWGGNGGLCVLREDETVTLILGPDREVVEGVVGSVIREE
jgi:hypothetical protein